MRHPLDSSAAASLANNCENKRNMAIFESKTSPWRFKSHGNTHIQHHEMFWQWEFCIVLGCVLAQDVLENPPVHWQGEEE